MYNARLLGGVPFQVQIPKGVERSKEGALYFFANNPQVISDEEAAYIQDEMKNPKSGLHGRRLVLEKVPEAKKAEAVPEIQPEPVPEAKAVAAPAEPEPTPEVEPDEAEPKESADDDSKPKGKSGRRRRKG